MNNLLELFTTATGETLLMVSFSTLFSIILGFPLGVVLYATDRGGIAQNRVINTIIGWAVNSARSFPFIILMIVLFPLSRLIVGTTIGTVAAIVPLSIAASPFVARVIEGALKEVSPGVIEASRSMGSSTFQIILKVLIPEALPGIVTGITLTIINLIGYSAMSGAIGGRGIGDVAIREGFYKFKPDILAISVVILLIFVQTVQISGNYISNRLIKRR